MFRVMDLHDGKVALRELSEDSLAPPPEGVIRWIDLQGGTAPELDLLRTRFGFDDMSLGDCVEIGTQPKAIEHYGYQFIVIHAFTKDPCDELSISVHEVHAFLSERYLVTVHDDPVASHEQTWQQALADPIVLERGPDWALYLCADAMVSGADPLVQLLREELDELDRSVIEDGSDVDLVVVFRIKRVAFAMRRVLRPLRDTFHTLLRRPDQAFSERTRRYLHDLSDHVVRLAEQVDEVREVSVGVVSGFQALQAGKANEVMKRLTIFSAVFLPLSFIVGFWGQNFVDMPYDSGLWLAVMLVSLVAVPAGLMEWFRRNWL